MAEIKIPITYSLESLDKISSQFDELIKKSNISDLFKPDQEKIRGFFAAIRKEMEEQLTSGKINVKAIDFTKAQKAIEKFASKVAYVLDEAFDQDTLPLIKKITGITETITNTQDEIKKLKTEFDSLISGNKNKLDEFKNKFASAFGKDAPTDLEGAKLQLADAQKSLATPANSGAANVEMYRQLVDMAENYQGSLTLQTSILNLQKELEQAITKEKDRQLKDEQEIQVLKEKSNATNVQLAFPDIAANNKAYEEQVNAYKEIKSAVDDTYNSIRQMESKFSAPERIILARAAKPGATNTRQAKELMGEDEFTEYKRLNDQYDRAAELLRQIAVSISEIDKQSRGTTWYADKLKAIELLYQKTGELTQQQEALKFSDMDLAKEIALGSAGAQDFADKMRLSNEDIQKLKEYIELEEKIRTLRLAAKNLGETRLGINLTDEKERLKELQNTLSSFNIDSDTKDIFLNNIPADANPDEEFARTGGYGLSQEQFKQYIKTLAEYKIQLQVVLASEATLSETGKAMAEEKARQNEKSEQIAARELENKKQQNIATRQQLELQKQILSLQSALDSRKKKEETFKQRFNLTELPTTDPAVAQSMLAKAQSESTAGQDTTMLQQKTSLLRELVEILQEGEDIKEKSLEISEKEAELQDALNEKVKLEVQLQQAKTNLGSEESLNVSQDLLKSSEELNDVKAAGAGVDKESTKEIKANTKAKKDNSDEDDKGTKSIVEKGLATISYTFIMSNLRKALNETLKAVREIDKAMTEAAIVTNMNRKEAYKLLPAYQQLARNTALATSEIGGIVVEFLKQGRSVADSMQLAEVAAKSAKVAGIDARDAVDYLTAAVNGFNLAATDAEMIADKFSAIAAASASDFEELAIAMSKVAPSAKVAGVGVDFMMGVLAKGLETTREAPENIGTAFKTIFARMREVTDIGKATEDGMSLNRVEKALQSIGVQLRDSTGQFRNLETILIEVGEQFDTLSSIEQAYIATALAGTRQQPRLLAIFNDFARTKELIEISTNSVGDLSAQHSEYMQGAEAALAQLKTAWEGFIMAFTDAEIVVGTIQLFADAINVITGFFQFLGQFTNMNMFAIGGLTLAFVALGIQMLNNERIKQASLATDRLAIEYSRKSVSLDAEKNKLISEKIRLTRQLQQEVQNLRGAEREAALEKINVLQNEIKTLGDLKGDLGVVKTPLTFGEEVMKGIKAFIKDINTANVSIDTLDEGGKQLQTTIQNPAPWANFGKFIGTSILQLIKLAGQMLVNIAIMAAMSLGISLLFSLLGGLFTMIGDAFADIFFGADHFAKKVNEVNTQLKDLNDKEKGIKKLVDRFTQLENTAFKTKEQFEEMAALGKELENVEFEGKTFNLTRTDATGKTAFDEKEYKKLLKLIEESRQALLEENVNTLKNSLNNDFWFWTQKTFDNPAMMKIAQQVGYDFGLNFVESLGKSVDDKIKQELKIVAKRLSEVISVEDFKGKGFYSVQGVGRQRENVATIEEAREEQSRGGGTVSRREANNAEEMLLLYEAFIKKMMNLFTEQTVLLNKELDKVIATTTEGLDRTTQIFTTQADAYQRAAAEIRRTVTDPEELILALQILNETMLDGQILNDLINGRDIEARIIAKMSIDLDLQSIADLFDEFDDFFNQIDDYVAYLASGAAGAANQALYGRLNEILSDPDFLENIFEDVFSNTAEGIYDGFGALTEALTEGGLVSTEKAEEMILLLASKIKTLSMSEVGAALEEQMKLAKDTFNFSSDIAKGEFKNFAKLVEAYGLDAAKKLLSGNINDIKAFFEMQNKEMMDQIDESIAKIEAVATARVAVGGEGLSDIEKEEIEGLKLMKAFYEEIAIYEQLRNYRLKEASELLKEMNNLLSLQKKLLDLGISGPFMDVLSQIMDQSYTEGLGSFISQFNEDMKELTDTENGFVTQVDGVFYFNPDEYGRGEALIGNVFETFTQLIDAVTAAYNRQKQEIEARYKAEIDAINSSHDERWSQIDFVNKLAEAEEKIIEGRRRLAGLVISGMSRGTLEQAQKDLKKLQEERQRIIEQQMVDEATKDLEKQMDEELIEVQKQLTAALDGLIAEMVLYRNVLTGTQAPGTGTNIVGDASPLVIKTSVEKLEVSNRDLIETNEKLILSVDRLARVMGYTPERSVGTGPDQSRGQIEDVDLTSQTGITRL